MKIVVLMLIIMFFAISAQAEEEETKPLVYRDTQGNSLTLQGEACPLKGWFTKWRLARWIWRGDQYEACWRLMLGATPHDAMIYTVDSNGDIGRIPAVYFSEDQGV